MPVLTESKKSALAWIESERERLSAFADEIWNYAEPSWREYRSAKAYVDLLEKEGFDVEAGSGEMPTAFMATWGDGGPVIGSYAEYDAVPGNSQQAVPYRAPREGLHPYTAGHTDPHSMLGTATLTGLLATKAAMEQHGITGTLRYFGEPAEKMCGSKPVHAAKGYYDGVDAFLCYHPHPNNTVVWETHCGSYWSVVFTFECSHPEKWGSVSSERTPGVKSNSHTVARCPGVIDALMLMYTTTKYTKEAMFPHTGAWTLNEFILAGGDATSDNLPPKFAQIQYAWRSPTLEIQQRIYEVLENNARQAAAVTGCEASVRWVTKTRVGLANNALADLAYQNMELAGPPTYGEGAKQFAREIQKNLDLTPMDEPFDTVFSELTDPRDYEARLRTALPDWQLNYTSDDYVEYTWHAPSVRVYTARPVVKSPDVSYQYPPWVYNATGGRSQIVDPGMFLAGQTIAMTALDLLTEPETLKACQDEFVKRTGGGVGGEDWEPPLLSSDFDPPVDLHWPEYVKTARGDEWYLPTEHSSQQQNLS